MADLGVFVNALLSLAKQGVAAAIYRSIWGAIVEPSPERAGTWKFGYDSARVELTRFDYLYGYLRLAIGNCRAEGVLVYRQKYVEFRPQLIEGCDEISGGQLIGIEPLEED